MGPPNAPSMDQTGQGRHNSSDDLLAIIAPCIQAEPVGITVNAIAEDILPSAAAEATLAKLTESAKGCAVPELATAALAATKLAAIT